MLLCIVFFYGISYWINHPILKKNQNDIEFRIIAGSDINRAAQQIVNAGISLNPLLFTLLARVRGEDICIKVGNYKLKLGVTPLQLLKQLVRGECIQETLTFIEGSNFHQMRQIIAKHQGLQHDTLKLSDTALLAKITDKYIVPEGLFFPDTYIFTRGTSDLQIYRQAFFLMQKHLNDSWSRRSISLPYKSSYEALIMASIIEKETGHNAERGLIAGVFVNRLKAGILLQTDPTVIYGMGSAYHGNIHKHDLLVDTPYNTYIRKGIPPTPIALPGAKSLAAAMNPVKTEALYFVARGDGTSHFSKNLNEHNQAVNKYQR